MTAPKLVASWQDDSCWPWRAEILNVDGEAADTIENVWKDWDFPGGVDPLIFSFREGGAVYAFNGTAKGVRGHHKSWFLYSLRLKWTKLTTAKKLKRTESLKKGKRDMKSWELFGRSLNEL